MENNPQFDSNYLKENFESAYKAITYARSQEAKYPDYVSKPVLSKKHDAGEAVLYAASLKKYELDMADHDMLTEEAKTFNHKIDAIVEEYVRDFSGLNSVVPEQYRTKVYRLAWEDGHSGGYHEVYNKLVDLVDIFK